MLPLSIAYVASAFGWRTWKQRRTTGDTGLRMGRSGTVTGLALMASGVVGTLAAQTDLGRSWRIGVDPTEETDLVTTGAFAVVRNPIFTAMAAFSLGAVLAQRTPRSTVAAATMLAAIEMQVRLIEEPYLRWW